MIIKTEEQIAVEKLRTMFVQGKFPRGEFLSQRKLAKETGTAVITLRGALRTLENDGIIENVPRWGVRIPEENNDKLRDRYYIREVLEAAAVKKIIEQDNPEHWTQLRIKAKICDEVERKANNTELFGKLHYEFHNFLAECSNSEMLVNTIRRISLRTMMHWNAQRGWARGKDSTVYHHQQLVEDISSKDLERAEKAIKEHVERGLNFELDALNDLTGTEQPEQ